MTRKKFIALLIALVMMLSVMPMAMAEDGDHQNDPSEYGTVVDNDDDDQDEPVVEEPVEEPTEEPADEEPVDEEPEAEPEIEPEVEPAVEEDEDDEEEDEDDGEPMLFVPTNITINPFSALPVQSTEVNTGMNLAFAAGRDNIALPAQGAIITVPHSNGGVSGNIINNQNKTGNAANTTWNTWGASQGTVTNRFHVTLSWNEPKTISGTSILWWIFTDTGVIWPRNARVYVSNDVFPGTLTQGNANAAQATALAALTWTYIGDIGVERNGNVPGGGAAAWIRNTMWNNLEFDAPVTARHIRISVENRASGTSPGFGINAWQVFETQLPCDDCGIIICECLRTITNVAPITAPGLATSSVLTAGAVTHTPADKPATFTRQWQVADSPAGPWRDITGAIGTGGTFTLRTADIGRYIRVITTGIGFTNGLFESPAVGPVVRGFDSTLVCQNVRKIGRAHV